MKIVLIIVALSTLLFSDEIQRIQSIVDDITKLRVEYESCKKQLSSDLKGSEYFDAMAAENDEKLQTYKMNLKDEKQRNEILLAEIDVFIKEKNDLDILKAKISKLEKIVKNQENSLKVKEEVIKNLKIDKVKTKEVSKNNLNSAKKIFIEKQVVCEEPNSFPKLLMKKESPNQVKDIEETYTFEAAAFRLKNEATIYRNINGEEIYVWEEDRSFTSNEKSQNWVKITGYFIDKKWLPSKEELWVEASDVVQR